MTTKAAVRTLIPPRLKPGDRVRVVSPASPPDREPVARGVEVLAGWGLEVELGEHVFDRVGYLAGTDEQRLADLNDAYRDPGVRAIFATRGGKGAYRITDGLDFEAVRRDPKPMVGFSDITALHLALWKNCRLVGFHGPCVYRTEEYPGPGSAEALHAALTTTAQTIVRQNPDELTAALTDGEPATGVLMGGNLDAVRNAVGSDLPSLAGGILLIESTLGTGLGMVDRQLTQLIRSGLLDGLRGIAVGQFTGFDNERAGDWSLLDVMRDRFAKLDVPVLGGLPVGHGPRSATVPLGTTATIAPAAGTLTVAPGVQ